VRSYVQGQQNKDWFKWIGSLLRSLSVEGNNALLWDKITIQHTDNVNNNNTTYPPSSAPVHHIAPSNLEEPAQRT
jgi:hypothetical protein